MSDLEGKYPEPPVSSVEEMLQQAEAENRLRDEMIERALRERAAAQSSYQLPSPPDPLSLSRAVSVPNVPMPGPPVRPIVRSSFISAFDAY